MLIDCKNQECPQPVVNTKNALNSLKDGDILEVLVNAQAPLENVQRYARSQGCCVSHEKCDDGYKINIVKSSCEVQNEVLNKVFFIKDDKIGEGELGEKLMLGFLQNILEQPSLPQKIILVNQGVFLTTKNHQTIQVLKGLEVRGVEIVSCGMCLEFLGLKDGLCVGHVGDAYTTVNSLLNSKGVISL